MAQSRICTICARKQVLGRFLDINSSERVVFTQNATNIFVPQKSKNGKAYPKKMEFYSEYLRNDCKLWFWLIIFQSTA